GEEGVALEDRLLVELEVIDHPAGEVVLRRGGEEPLIHRQHRRDRATTRRRMHTDAEVHLCHATILPLFLPSLRPAIIHGVEVRGSEFGVRGWEGGLWRRLCAHVSTV